MIEDQISSLQTKVHMLEVKLRHWQSRENEVDGRLNNHHTQIERLNTQLKKPRGSFGVIWDEIADAAEYGEFPPRHGDYWAPDEDKELIHAFESFIESNKVKHMRTRGAIYSRLKKLNVIEIRED